MPLSDEDREKLDAYFGQDTEHPLKQFGIDPRAPRGAGELLLAAGIPALALASGEAGLTALGLDETGLVPALIRSGASGLLNLGMSKGLPEGLGGVKGTSPAADFAWGAVPEAASIGLRALPEALAERSLNHGAESFGEAARKNILNPENLRVQNELLQPPRNVPFPDILQGSVGLTDQANEAREPIQKVIRATRQKYGAPIGEAYRALKGDQVVDANGFGAFVDKLRDNQIAPSPAAEKYLTQIKNMDPEVQREAWERQQAALAAQQQATPAVPKMPSSQALQESLQALGYKSFDQVPDNLKGWILQQSGAGAEPAAVGGGAGPQEEFKPRNVTLDDLRNLRQRVNLDLQRAKGGDVYTLGRIQDELDNQLMDHLPDNMSELRKNYRGFISRWGYAKEHQLENLADPNEVSKFIFSKPRDAYELMQEADTPQAKDALRSRFVQYVWGDVDRTATGKEQAAAIRKKLAPYMQNSKVAKEMLGDRPGERMGEMVSWAKYAPDLDQQLQKNPNARKAFQQTFRDYFVKRGMDPNQATTAAMQDLMRQMPGAPQGAVDITGSTPLLQGGGKSGHQASFAHVLAARHTGMAALGIGLGRPDAAAYQAAMAISWLANGNGYEASMRFPGATRFFLNAFKDSNPARAGWWIARGMDTVIHGGAQTFRQNANEPVEIE